MGKWLRMTAAFLLFSTMTVLTFRHFAQEEEALRASLRQRVNGRETGRHIVLDCIEIAH